MGKENKGPPFTACNKSKTCPLETAMAEKDQTLCTEAPLALRSEHLSIFATVCQVLTYKGPMWCTAHGTVHCCTPLTVLQSSLLQPMAHQEMFPCEKCLDEFWDEKTDEVTLLFWPWRCLVARAHKIIRSGLLFWLSSTVSQLASINFKLPNRLHHSCISNMNISYTIWVREWISFLAKFNLHLSCAMDFLAWVRLQGSSCNSKRFSERSHLTQRETLYSRFKMAIRAEEAAGTGKKPFYRVFYGVLSVTR